jgi:hypothetical protein
LIAALMALSVTVSDFGIMMETLYLGLLPLMLFGSQMLV